MDNHLALNYNLNVLSDVQKICHILFAHSCIKSFRYFRVFENGLYFNISTNHEWLRERMLKIPDNGKSFHKPLCAASSDKYSFFLWQNNLADPIVSLFQDFNIFNGITAYKRKGDSVEAWSFGATLEDTLAPNFYINNMDFLKKFMVFFNNVAKEIINVSDRSKLAQFNEKVPIKEQMKTSEDPFLLLSDPSSPQGDQNYLSGRELECLQLLSKGRTFKEAARNMEISPRTIESYVNSMKIKLNLQSKSDLIKYYWENNHVY